jgi:hypothetical protein
MISMARNLLDLIRPMISVLEGLYPPVKLMINFDHLHDAYIIRASAPGYIKESIQFVYQHEIERASLVPTVANLFHERTMEAIRVILPAEFGMQGATEYDEIMQASEIMDQLKP